MNDTVEPEIWSALQNADEAASESYENMPQQGDLDFVRTQMMSMNSALSRLLEGQAAVKQHLLAQDVERRDMRQELKALGDDRTWLRTSVGSLDVRITKIEENREKESPGVKFASQVHTAGLWLLGSVITAALAGAAGWASGVFSHIESSTK